MIKRTSHVLLNWKPISRVILVLPFRLPVQGSHKMIKIKHHTSTSKFRTRSLNMTKRNPKKNSCNKVHPQSTSTIKHNLPKGGLQVHLQCACAHLNLLKKHPPRTASLTNRQETEESQWVHMHNWKWDQQMHVTCNLLSTTVGSNLIWSATRLLKDEQQNLPILPSNYTSCYMQLWERYITPGCAEVAMNLSKWIPQCAMHMCSLQCCCIRY